VAVSGVGQEDDQAPAHEAGIDAQLSKPVDAGSRGRLLARLGHSATARN